MSRRVAFLLGFASAILLAAGAAAYGLASGETLRAAMSTNKEMEP